MKQNQEQVRKDIQKLKNDLEISKKKFKELVNEKGKLESEILNTKNQTYLKEIEIRKKNELVFNLKAYKEFVNLISSNYGKFDEKQLNEFLNPPPNVNKTNKEDLFIT